MLRGERARLGFWVGGAAGSLHEPSCAALRPEHFAPLSQTRTHNKIATCPPFLLHACVAPVQHLPGTAPLRNTQQHPGTCRPTVAAQVFRPRDLTTTRNHNHKTQSRPTHSPYCFLTPVPQEELRKLTGGDVTPGVAAASNQPPGAPEPAAPPAQVHQPTQHHQHSSAASAATSGPAPTQGPEDTSGDGGTTGGQGAQSATEMEMEVDDGPGTSGAGAVRAAAGGGAAGSGQGHGDTAAGGPERGRGAAGEGANEGMWL